MKYLQNDLNLLIKLWGDERYFHRLYFAFSNEYPCELHCSFPMDKATAVEVGLADCLLAANDWLVYQRAATEGKQFIWGASSLE